MDTNAVNSNLFLRSALSRIAVVFAIGGAVFAVVRFTPLYQLWRHQQHYREAEATVDQIRNLTFQLDNISENSVRQLLKTDDFRSLSDRETQIARRPGELMWFQVNEVFTVGLLDDGGILWMRDGVRSVDR